MRFGVVCEVGWGIDFSDAGPRRASGSKVFFGGGVVPDYHYWILGA